jgi:hypothetical protein
MSLRSKLGILVLTRQEQRTIAFIVLALVLGLLTKHYRSEHSQSAPVPNEIKQSSPFPTKSPTLPDQKRRPRPDDPASEER